MLPEYELELEKICERSMIVSYRRSSFGFRKEWEFKKSLQKFSYIIDRYDRSYWAKQMIEIFVYDSKKFFLFLLDLTQDVEINKKLSIDTNFIRKVEQRKTLKKRDPKIYDLVSKYGFGNNMFNAIGSFYYYPTEHKHLDW